MVFDCLVLKVEREAMQTQPLTTPLFERVKKLCVRDFDPSKFHIRHKYFTFLPRPGAL